MENSPINDSERVEAEHDLDPTMSQAAADAISEIMSDLEVETESDEVIAIARQLFEKFTSPLMIQKAAGATSSVSVIMSPSGGLESARSVKGRNIQFNLKQAAIALPSTLPAFVTLFDKHGISDHIGHAAVLSILYLSGC